MSCPSCAVTRVFVEGKKINAEDNKRRNSQSFEICPEVHANKIHALYDRHQKVYLSPDPHHKASNSTLLLLFLLLLLLLLLYYYIIILLLYYYYYYYITILYYSSNSSNSIHEDIWKLQLIMCYMKCPRSQLRAFRDISGSFIGSGVGF